VSTVHNLFTENELEAFTALLKEWPNSAFGNDDLEISVSPFLSFYFPYSPSEHLEKTLSMIDIHQTFERLTGAPYIIATHPVSERPYPYGSTKIPDLKILASTFKVDESFAFNFTDESNHNNSPTTAGYFWRSSTWDGINNNAYSSILLHYRWQWWLENRNAWRNFLFMAIEKLKPHQVYSGFAVANPLDFGSRPEASTWERSLTVKFYGLDIEFPFGMRDELMDGVRPPTWVFLLSNYWREKLGLERDAVREALDHPQISITELKSGQWIELGEQPELYPVEAGLPELPILLNKIIRPIRHDDLGLVGFGQWSGDPNERFSDADAKRWISRFDEENDWPCKRARFLSTQTFSINSIPTAMPAGSPCPMSGWWTTPAKLESRRFFNKGEVFPVIRSESAKGEIIWLWDSNQGSVSLDGGTDA